MNKKSILLLICSLTFFALANISVAEEEKNAEAPKKEMQRGGPPKETWGIKGNFNTWGVITAASTPYFESQENQYIVFPVIDHPFFKYQGFQKDFYITPTIAITPSLTYAGNYSLDNNTLSGKYSDINNRYGSIEAGVAGSVNLGPYSAKLGMRADVSDSYNGNRFYLSLEGRKRLNSNMFQMMSYGLTYNNYSENFMDYYFGISESESDDTGLTEYHPGQCGSVSANLSLIKMINPNFTLIIAGGLEHLGERADSDILETRNSANLAAILNWKPN